MKKKIDVVQIIYTDAKLLVTEQNTEGSSCHLKP